mgnify:CR=1 FL=1
MKKKIKSAIKKVLKPCPSGFVRKNGRCVQAGVGPEYKP